MAHMLSSFVPHTSQHLSSPPVEQPGGGVVEAILWLDAPVGGAAGVDRSADLGGQDLAQLHAPLVKAVDAPDEALQAQEPPPWVGVSLLLQSGLAVACVLSCWVGPSMQACTRHWRRRHAGLLHCAMLLLVRLTSHQHSSGAAMSQSQPTAELGASSWSDDWEGSPALSRQHLKSTQRAALGMQLLTQAATVSAALTYRDRMSSLVQPATSSRRSRVMVSCTATVCQGSCLSPEACSSPAPPPCAHTWTGSGPWCKHPALGAGC